MVGRLPELARGRPPALVSTLRACRMVPSGGFSQCRVCVIAAAEDGPPTSPGPPLNITAAVAMSVTPAATGTATARRTRAPRARWACCAPGREARRRTRPRRRRAVRGRAARRRRSRSSVTWCAIGGLLGRGRVRAARRRRRALAVRIRKAAGVMPSAWAASALDRSNQAVSSTASRSSGESVMRASRRSPSSTRRQDPARAPGAGDRAAHAARRPAGGCAAYWPARGA